MTLMDTFGLRRLSELGNCDQIHKTKLVNNTGWELELEREQKKKIRITHIFSTHGFKHLLQLNSQLLDVVDQDAGLRTERCLFETVRAH